MTQHRAGLERQFLHLCRRLGPAWIESVIRPLRLPGATVAVRDIPTHALLAAVAVFAQQRRVSAE